MVWAARVARVLSTLDPSGLLYRPYEKRLLTQLSHDRLPQHVAVMADGNRRWARRNAPDEPIAVGYDAGADKLKEFVGWCEEVGIPTVTVWVLSTENLDRSDDHEFAPWNMAVNVRERARACARERAHRGLQARVGSPVVEHVGRRGCRRRARDAGAGGAHRCGHGGTRRHDPRCRSTPGRRRRGRSVGAPSQDDSHEQ